MWHVWSFQKGFNSSWDQGSLIFQDSNGLIAVSSQTNRDNSLWLLPALLTHSPPLNHPRPGAGVRSPGFSFPIQPCHFGHVPSWLTLGYHLSLGSWPLLLSFLFFFSHSPPAPWPVQHGFFQKLLPELSLISTIKPFSSAIPRNGHVLIFIQ